MRCPGCWVENQNGNFCSKCGRKLKETCDCWVKKEPYNCGYDHCPGYRLLVFGNKRKSILSEFGCDNPTMRLIWFNLKIQWGAVIFFSLATIVSFIN